MARDNQRIVCAANRLPDGHVILGARHWDKFMHQAADAHLGHMGLQEADLECGDAEQGFIDQWGTFYSRTDAWVIAERAGQIIRQVSTPGELYSENLY